MTDDQDTRVYLGDHLRREQESDAQTDRFFRSIWEEVVTKAERNRRRVIWSRRIASLIYLLVGIAFTLGTTLFIVSAYIGLEVLWGKLWP